MSPREKNILIIFSVAGFLVLNLLGFNWFTDYRAKIERDRKKAQSELNIAKQFLASREQVLGEMDWLVDHEPKAAAIQDVQTNLQQLAEREARSRGLTIKAQKLLPGDVSGVYYHRAKVEFSVSGPDQALIGWIDRLQVPTEFRAVTALVMLPNKEDDTKLDAKLTIEQWFVPQPNDL